MLHVLDGLTGALPAGGTLVGGELYLLLVVSTVLTVWLVDGPADSTSAGTFGRPLAIGWGALGGSVNGVLFLLGLVAALPDRESRKRGPHPLVLAIGSVIAAVVGLLLGFAFVFVNHLLIRTAGG